MEESLNEPKTDIYIQKRIISALRGNTYSTIIDAEISYEEGELVGSLYEKLDFFEQDRRYERD